MSERYRGMPKWRFMLLRGWPTLLGVVTLGVFDCVPGWEPWFARPFILLFMLMNGWLFFRWETSWQHWQDINLPTDEQAQAMIESLRQQANAEVDPFMRQIGNEAVLEIDRWITGKREDDDR